MRSARVFGRRTERKARRAAAASGTNHVPTRVSVVKRSENWGIGRHLIDARRRLFDEQEYDCVLLFEDDMVLAPSYVETLLSMLSWASDYNDVGTVMAYNINPDLPEHQQHQFEEVVATNRHFWGYGMLRSVWDDIKSLVYEFENRFLQGVSYNQRAHRSIRWRFIRRVMKQPRLSRRREPRPLRTSHAAVFHLALSMSNQPRRHHGPCPLEQRVRTHHHPRFPSELCWRIRILLFS